MTNKELIEIAKTCGADICHTDCPYKKMDWKNNLDYRHCMNQLIINLAFTLDEELNKVERFYIAEIFEELNVTIDIEPQEEYVYVALSYERDDGNYSDYFITSKKQWEIDKKRGYYVR